MKQAAILKNGNIISTTDFNSLNYFISGHLESFKVTNTGKVFAYFVNLNDKDGGYSGYYEKESYLKFKAGLILNISTIDKFTNWKFPNIGDEIVIKKRLINYSQAPLGNISYCWNQYKKTFEEGMQNISLINDIDVTTYIIDTLNSKCGLQTINEAAYNFFLNNIINADEEDYELINTIGNIAQTINNIDYFIYNAFNSFAFLDIESLKQSQNNFWSSVFNTIIDSQSYEVKKTYYLNYYSTLTNYYEGVSNYLKAITDGNDIVKSIALASSLHPMVLINISASKKLEMIKYIAKEKFVINKIIIPEFQYSLNGKKGFLSLETIQNLIVNLTLSFEGQSAIPNNQGISEIDVFLTGLLDEVTDGILFTEEVTFFELIYNNLNQSFNITEGLLGITNLVFKTNFKPNNTKGAFIQAMYSLWQFSKYNPYDFDGEIRPKTIGNKILDNSTNSLAKFDNENDPANINCLYYYTNEIAYLKTVNQYNFVEFSIAYENASPIMMPYESDKSLGIFKDNFKFEIKGKKIIANKDIWEEQNSAIKKEYIKYGTYDIYQPVSLINTNLDTKVPIVTTTGIETEINGNKINSLIPVFVLKYIDDAGDQSDAETMLGYLVDVALTFSGIGNLTKLKHLRYAALAEGQIGVFSKVGLRVVLGGIEFSSGVIGFFANFVTCSEPTVPNTIENATVWDNYRFCQNMKTFIMMFQVATLSISAGDTIASLALKKQAARVIKNAGGGVDEATILNNLENKLGATSSSTNQQLIEEVAEKISDLGKTKYLNTAADLLIEVNKIYDKIQPSLLSITKGPNKFSLKHLKSHFNETNMKIVIQDCLELGITDQRTIHDIILTSCRGETLKQLTFNETRIVINYYGKVIRERGFPTGFHNLADYKLFSQKVKTYLDDYCNTWGIKNAKYEIQGSSQFKSHQLDPNVNDVPVLTKNGSIVAPDDLDGRILISQHQANKFLKEMKDYWTNYYKLQNPNMDFKKIKGLVNDKMEPIIKKANKDGIIHRGDMPPLGYVEDLRQAVKRNDGSDIFYPVSSKLKDPNTGEFIPDVGFAIVIQRTNFDIQPAMSLKF